MIPQKIKEIYWFFLYPASFLLRPLYQLDYRLRKRHIKKIQIGGGATYLAGFINLDASFFQRVDYLLDTRVGLPFPDNSIELIYSCHMLEHLFIEEALSALKEWRRVLSPSGYLRLTLPDFDHAQKILSGQGTSFFPRSFKSRSGMAINFLFCEGQHKYAYNFELLEELAKAIGFSKLVPAEVGRDENIKAGGFSEPPGSFSVNLFK